VALSSSRGCRDARKATSASGSFRPGVGSDLHLSLLLSVRGVRGGNYGVYVHHVDEAETPRTMKSPYLVRQMSKWFYNTSTGTATGAVNCGSFVGEGLDISDVSYRGTQWRQGVMWFRPPERNTLCPQAILCCITIGSLKALVMPLVALDSAGAF
jgi:hypothetical protein